MADTKFIEVPCDVCGSGRKAFAGFPDTGEIRKMGLNIPENIVVVKCAKCGFYYTSPMPFWGDEDLNKLYSRGYYDKYADRWKKIKEVINPNRRLSTLEKLSDHNISRFLELGCGEGSCLKQAMKRGWSVHGQDVSSFFAGAARNNAGAEVFLGRLEEAKYPDNYFDAVYADSVLEHVPQVSKMIKEIHRILRPGGLFYVVCPNEDALVKHIKQLYAGIRGKSASVRLAPFVNPYHINGFSKRAIKRLAETNSFEVKSVFIGKEYYIREHGHNIREKVSGILGRIVYFAGNATGCGTNLEAVLMAVKQEDV